MDTDHLLRRKLAALQAAEIAYKTPPKAKAQTIENEWDLLPGLLRVPAAAKYVGVSKDFVRRTLKHQVPYVQHNPSGPLFFWKTDLDRWLASHTVQPARR